MQTNWDVFGSSSSPYQSSDLGLSCGRMSGFGSRSGSLGSVVKIPIIWVVKSLQHENVFKQYDRSSSVKAVLCDKSARIIGHKPGMITCLKKRFGENCTLCDKMNSFSTKSSQGYQLNSPNPPDFQRPNLFTIPLNTKPYQRVDTLNEYHALNQHFLVCFWKCASSKRHTTLRTSSDLFSWKQTFLRSEHCLYNVFDQSADFLGEVVSGFTVLVDMYS